MSSALIIQRREFRSSTSIWLYDTDYWCSESSFEASQNPSQLITVPLWITLHLLQAGLEKMFISLQTGQNFSSSRADFPPVWNGFPYFFFISFFQITRFPSKELPVLPIFSRPGLRCPYQWPWCPRNSPCFAIL